jgi:hypothetical protein
MSISGNLKTMQASDILQWLAQGGYTGTLVVSNGQVEKSIYFRDGAVISSASTDPKEFLGHFLVSHGFISEEELAAAIRKQEQTRTLIGRILVDQGSISEEDVHKMLSLKAEESIYDFFMWPEGEFRFLDGELPDYEMVPISLGVTGILLEGMQRIDEWQGIREKIPSPHTVPVAVVDLLDDKKLGDGQRAVLGLVNDDRSIEEICLQTHSSEYYVCNILMEKIRQGKLKVVRPRGIKAEDKGPSPVSAHGLISEARRYFTAGEYELTLRHLRAAGSLEPNDHEIQQQIERIRAELRANLEAEGVIQSGIPQLNMRMEDLTSINLSPEEGFVLSRINGTSNLASIMKISPLPELDAMLVFWKLLRAEHIRLSA